MFDDETGEQFNPTSDLQVSKISTTKQNFFYYQLDFFRLKTIIY